MKKTILVTGATDGIGKLVASTLASQGHEVLVHGRSAAKVANAAAEIGGDHAGYVADFSRLAEVDALAQQLLDRHARLDVLINNAGVLHGPVSPNSAVSQTPDGLDLRFAVNALAPYRLTRRLLPIIPKHGRVVNLSSAAQAPVDPAALSGGKALDAMSAYAQSKLALTIWSQELARELDDGPVVVSVNPGSLLATKMVREGFGMEGNDLRIGSRIVCEAALDASFAAASGRYFDNDARRFRAPHPAAADRDHVQRTMEAMHRALDRVDARKA